MSIKSDETLRDGARLKLFYILLNTVFVYTICYSGIFLYFEARLAALLLFFSSITLYPLTLILEKQGHPTAARFLFCFSALFYITASATSIPFHVGFEYYYFAALMLPVFIFDTSQRAYILVGMSFYPAGWALNLILPQLVTNAYWVPTALNTKTFVMVNFIGASLIIALFLKNFVGLFSQSIEQARQRSQELDRFFEVSVDMLAIAGLDGMFKKINPAFSKRLGFSDKELLSSPFVSFVHADDVESTLHEIAKLAQGSQSLHFENRYRCKDGSYRYLSWNTTPDVKAQLIYAAARDITEYRLQEERLEEAQRVAKIGSWSFDLSTRRIFWSKQMFQLFNEDIKLGPPTYEKHFQTIHLDDRELWLKHVNGCLEHGLAYKIRFRSVFPDKVLWVETIGQATYNGEGKIAGISGTCQDVTDFVIAEDQAKLERSRALQKSKLASLGELAAGVAHEINNPLAIISGIANLLPRYAKDEAILSTNIARIQKAAQRIEKIVYGLKKFSRSSESVSQSPHSLKLIIEEALVLIAAKATTHSTKLDFKASSVGVVLCNEIEIEQVMINLLGNSIDAVKDLPEKWVNVELEESTESIIVYVRDSGKGIPPKVRAKLFEPFFTTKTVGQGTGLGLSIVRGIMLDHNASIELVNSDPNTCFKLVFKKAEDQKVAA